MKIGVLIPDRGDRPKLTKHCFKMIERQTLKPDHIEHVNHTPKSNDYDLTERVRIGFDHLISNGCDCVLVMENDDFYSKHYIEEMVSGWIQNGKPELFGYNSTTYYHIFKKQYNILSHPNRASLMNTLISCSVSIEWPADNFVFLDLELWKQLDGVSVSDDKNLCTGMKHGVGLCGGRGHHQMQYPNQDGDSSFLRSIVDEYSFNFYLGL